MPEGASLSVQSCEVTRSLVRSLVLCCHALLVGLTYALAGAEESAGLLLSELNGYAGARSMRDGKARVHYQRGLVQFFANEAGDVIMVDVVIGHVKDLVDAKEWNKFHDDYAQKLKDGATSSDGLSSMSQVRREIEGGSI